MKAIPLFEVLLSALILTQLISSGAPRGSPDTPPGRTPEPAELPAADRARIADTFGKLPVSFIENRGQTDERVAYYVQSPGRSLYFTDAGHALRLSKGKGDQAKAHTVMVELVDAATQRIEGRQRAPGVVSYFKGPREQWKAGIPTQARIGYVQPWPGIDLAYDGSGGKIESIYTVAPHASPDQIRLRYSGQESLRLDDGGNLVYATSVGEVKETAPIAYQEIDGIRIPVETRYALLDERTVGFQVASYNPEHALVIDPTLVYAGYIGGSDHDAATAIAVDSAGNAYVAGSTTSISFPVVGGPDLTHSDSDNPDINAGPDVFVVKVSADGGALVYAGFIGGSGEDSAKGIAVDSAGSAYVTGITDSTEPSFPVLAGPDLTYNGGGDAFVAKVTADGSALVYAGYIGGSKADSASGIAVDALGNAYVAGTTQSTESSFPVVGGPDLIYNGTGDAFVAKVNAAGSALVYAGYIGGNSPDSASSVAVDSAGNAYVAGNAESTQASFPVTVGPDLTHNGEGLDAFVAKVNASGSALAYAGYIGGDAFDVANGVAVDSAGNAYVAGSTSSTEATFPVTVGPDLTHNGGGDAFVAKVNADGDALAYAGYIGGSDSFRGNDTFYFLNTPDSANSVAVDSAGNAYVAGSTSSTEFSFPVTGGPDLTHNGGFHTDSSGGEDPPLVFVAPDAFVAKVNAAGGSLAYAGYIGGDIHDFANAIAVDSAGNAYVAGNTYSNEATFPVTVGPDLTHNGGGDAFVAKITEVDITPDAFTFQDQTDVALEIEITSNAVTITGLDATAPISVAGGTYSINSGAFTSAVGTVSNGDMVQVRHTSSASFSTATDTVLTVGGVSDTFTSTTGAPPPDSVPDAFTFIDQSGVTPSTQITSNAVTVTGIDAATDISVTGGTYSISGGAFTNATGTVTSGQTVQVRHTSSASFSTATDTVLTVGGISDTFTSTTAPQDGVPNAFTFVDQSGVARGTQITSASVTITGINVASAISVTDGLYSIDNGAFTSVSGTVTDGQTVRVRHTSSAGYSTATSTVLTVGGVSDTFTSTTVSAPPPSGGGSGGSLSLPLLVALAGLLGSRSWIGRGLSAQVRRSSG